MKPTDPRIDMPRTGKAGEVIQIKTKIRHPMETGWRKTNDGKTIERNRLTKFSCTFEGQPVVSAEYDSGISQDPYFLFHARVTKAGTFTFIWEGDHDQKYTASVPFTLTNSSTS